jgi:hypothetical protein
MSLPGKIVGVLQALYGLTPKSGTLTTLSGNLTVSGPGGNVLLVQRSSDFVTLLSVNTSQQLSGPVEYFFGSNFDAGLARAGAGVIESNNGTAGGPGGIRFASLSPTALASSTNDYAPGVGSVQRWTASAAVNVTGMAAGLDGEVRVIWNIGSTNTITLTNEDALSAATNRFHTSTGASLALAANKAALAVYDGTTGRWRVSLLP